MTTGLETEDPAYVKLEPGRFGDWLRGQDPEAICGLAHKAEECPLAHYLREANGVLDVMVGQDVYRVVLPEGDTGFRPAPGWVADFVALIDRMPTTDEQHFPPVSVRKALAALDRALRARAGR